MLDEPLKIKGVLNVGVVKTGGTSNYEELENKPQINGTELSGNLSSNDLGVQAKINSSNKLSSDLVDDTEGTNKFVTETEKNTWNAKANTSDIPDTSEFIKKDVSNLDNYYDKETTDSKLSSKANTNDIPDVSNFITKSVNDLTNYYLKSETYTKAEVANLIGAIQQFHYEIVNELPETGESNILYLVPKTTSETSNVYDEYVYANGNFEKIGDTQIDLSNYVTTETLNTALANYVTSTGLATILSDYLLKSDKNAVVTLEQYEIDVRNLDIGIYYPIGNNISLLNKIFITFKSGIGIMLNDKGLLFVYYDNYHKYKNGVYLTQHGNSFNLIYHDGFNIKDFDFSQSFLTKNNTTAYDVTTDYQPAHKKYVDDAVSNASIQYSTMPTADSGNVGKVIQYIGETTEDYTNGYFYICTETTENEETTYNWENLQVQNGDSEVPIYYFDGDRTSESNIAMFQEMYEKYLNNSFFSCIWQYGGYGRFVFEYIRVNQSINEAYFYFRSQSLETEQQNYGMRYKVFNYNYVAYNLNNKTISYSSRATDFYAINNSDGLVSRANTTSWTPTQDYGLVHKKYVDDKPTTYVGYDATKTQVLKNINGTLTWVDE